jgi:hypothetical protein
MLSLRLLRPRAPARGVVRLATTAVHPTVTRTSSPSSTEAAIPLSNVEAQWERLTPDEQLVIHRQLEEIQKRDWKTLSLDEKRAGEVPLCILTLPPSHFDVLLSINRQPTISRLDLMGHEHLSNLLDLT